MQSLAEKHEQDMLRFYSAQDMAARGVVLDPVKVQGVANDTWADIAKGLTYGLKSVLSIHENELWERPEFVSYRPKFENERLGWKLSALSSVNGAYGAVKVIGANALNRHFGRPRSTSTILLFDKLTLLPLCILDGTEISAARTATYPVTVMDRFLAGRDNLVLFLFGAGPIAERTILSLQANAAARISAIYIRSRSQDTASGFAERLQQQTSINLRAVNDNSRLRQCDFVITASNSNRPVFAPDEIAPSVVLLNLGGDETPEAFVQQAIRRGTVCCDDMQTVSKRNSQSLARYFSNRGSTLEMLGPLLGIQNLADIAPRSVPHPLEPVFVTCVGLPVLDLYLAQYVFENFLARRS
jgi:alanine dehydrogenase